MQKRMVAHCNRLGKPVIITRIGEGEGGGMCGG